MSEEVRDAGLNVPRAMWWTFVLNGVMGLITMVTYVFCLPSVDDALNDPTGYPFLYVFQLAMPSSGTICLTVLLMLLMQVSNISYQASTARTTFAFARDKGLPFSKWIGKVDPKLHIPVNAVLLSAIITILLAAINIGSPDAYNAIVRIGVVEISTRTILTICTDLAWFFCPDEHLFHLHFLRTLAQTCSAKYIATDQMEPRKMGPYRKRSLHRLCLDCFVLPVLAQWTPGDCRKPQLGAGHVCGFHALGPGILLCQGQTPLQGPCLLHRGLEAQGYAIEWLALACWKPWSLSFYCSYLSMATIYTMRSSH